MLAGLLLEFRPPVVKPLDHHVAVGGNLLAGSEGSFCGWHVGQLHPVFHVINDSLEEGLADAEDVVAHEAYGAVAAIDNALYESVVRKLANIALRRA